MHTTGTDPGPSRSRADGTRRSSAPRLLATALGAAALGVAAPLAASAHVSLDADSTAAGSYALLTLNVPHGCEGAATTTVSMQVPASITAVTPTVHPGWTIEKVTQKLDTPVQTEGGKTLTTRDAEVVWTARMPLPDGYRDALSLQLQIPEAAAGQQLAFPTVQTCTKGETAWVQVPAPGQDHDELEHPAPVLTVTAAAVEDAHGASDTAAAAGHGAEPAPVQAELRTGGTAAAPGSAASTGSGLGIAGLVLGALGLAAGTTALARTRSAQTVTSRR